MPPPGQHQDKDCAGKAGARTRARRVMARVAGVDLPREKRGEVAVTYIYGIGRSTATRILSKANVDPAKKVKAWNDDETARIRELIERELKVEGDLRREISMNVKRLMD